MPPTLASTPRADGFRMPAEFEPHSACWMLFPQRPDNWRENGAPAQAAFAAVAAAIARFEPVIVGANADRYAAARAIMPDDVRVVELSNNDAWMRDMGATFVVNDAGAMRGVDWGFNAWGGLEKGLYFPWDKDEQVAQKMLEMAAVPRYAAPLIMEGGSFHVDGAGTLITTEECLLNPNRNPTLNRTEIEAYLSDYLAVDKVIWLEKGLHNDETDGHVDNIACFVRPGEVALAWTNDANDPNHAICADAYQRLSKATDARGQQLTVHKIPLPPPLYITEEESAGIVAQDGSYPRPAGERMAGSYINFYIANGGIIMPGFGVPTDAAAQAALAALFPEREVVAVPGREILLGGGNIHCITQQQPAKNHTSFAT